MTAVPPTARRAVLAAALAAAALSSGCAGLQTLQSVTAPTDLYDLTPKSTFAEDLPRIDRQLVVDEPTAASSVNTDRIAIKPSAYQIQYLPGVRWVDRAPRLVQTLLVESFENTGRVASVGRQAIGLSADYSLLTDLREFQAEIGAADAPFGVNVHLNIKVVKEPAGLIVASESFKSRVDARSDAMPDVVAAFDEALGGAMRAAVEWAVRAIAGIDSDRKGS